LRNELPNWLAAAIIIATAALLQAIPGATDVLRYQADSNLLQPWRFVTGHWVHLGWPHLALNAAGVIVVVLLFARDIRPLDWLAGVTLMPLAISCGFVVRNPQLEWYVGLSGALHGLLLAGCLLLWRTQRLMAMLTAAIVAAKLTHEQWAGAESATTQFIGGDVIVDAHLYGAVAGVAWGTARLLTVRRRMPAPRH
jgi:rhomboid family GlyGly-CTERM serine protease